MARQKSEFVSAFGTSFEIFKRIADEVMAQSGDDDDLRKILNDDVVVCDMVKVLRGSCVVQAIGHVVDCNVNPYIPQGWSLKGEGTEHRKGGQVKLERRGDDLYANGKNIELFLSDGQKNGKCIGGHQLRKELAEKPVLNANILDYLLQTSRTHSRELEGQIHLLLGRHLPRLGWRPVCPLLVLGRWPVVLGLLLARRRLQRQQPCSGFCKSSTRELRRSDLQTLRLLVPQPSCWAQAQCGGFLF